MGKIKITRKVTVKQQVHVQRRVQYAPPQVTYQTSAPVQIDTAPVAKALNDLSSEVKTAQRKLEAASRRRTIPSGVYGKPVEDVFYALDEQRKSEEEAKAMYDVFISHASEDKADFVNPLVEKLQDLGISVWYDTLELQWGKSLREQIDNGIKRSKFAILVLSKNFFKKQWPKRELDGILAKETISGTAPLPIWYNLTQEEVYEFSPTLSGIYSISTQNHSIDDICKAFQLILEKEPA